MKNISDESVDDKEKNVAQIRTLYANDLFEKKKYQESMREFLKLNTGMKINHTYFLMLPNQKHFIFTDPYDVIRLFPNLLPQSNSDYGEEVLEKEMEMKIVALIKYLTEVIYLILLKKIDLTLC